jgi:hypothetical protein
MATLKQKLAAQKVVENGGNIGKAMVGAGYSAATAKTPQKLTESKAWPALLEQYLPDVKLLDKHNEALEAKKVITSHTELDRVVPDMPTRLKAVELGYKVKGRLRDATIAQQFNVGGKMELEFIGEDE